MTTSLAFFCSMREVMWLMPYLTTTGFFLSTDPPLLAASASFKSLSFFAALSSGLYLRASLSTDSATFLSRVLVNWLTLGGGLETLAQDAPLPLEEDVLW